MSFFSSIKRLWQKDPAPIESRNQENLTPVPEQAPATAFDSIQVGTTSAPEAGSELTSTAAPGPKSTSTAEPELKSKSTPAPISSWQEVLKLSLREAKPKLSVWLNLVLEDLGPTAKASPALWERVEFLLLSLGIAAPEAQKFCQDFAAWAKNMEYDSLIDFRSELQYRLALALELEDEEDEQSRLLLKLQAGLAKTKAQLGKGLTLVFARHTQLNADFWEDLEELFIMADLGSAPSASLVKRLQTAALSGGITTPEQLYPLLTTEVQEIFRTPKRITAINPPEVILVIGVNGVGKTTTIAKLAYRAKMQGQKVLLVAADTFRAAAVEQLQTWANRTQCDFYAKGQGADPAAVAFEAMNNLANYDVIIIDTAGRLHTKTNLMEELKKIRTVIGKKHPGAPQRSILIVDATTGQNALQQVKIFKESAGIDEIILTKLDGTAKGGVAIALALEYKIPITYIGLGEKMEDLRPFSGDSFAKALLDR